MNGALAARPAGLYKQSPGRKQEDTPHDPLMQTVPDGHTRPHPPQLLESLSGFVHPLIGKIPTTSGHQISPVGQTDWQAPSTHEPPPGHTLPQAPQLLESVSTSAHPYPYTPGRTDFVAHQRLPAGQAGTVQRPCRH